MDRFTRRLLLSLLLLSANHAYAERTYVVSPSVGSASISNINGYRNSPFLRVDGTFYPIPEFGVGLFVADYSGFNSNVGGSEVGIKVTGGGAGVTGRWPVHPHAQPYFRVDYMRWNAEATGFGRTLAKDRGGSAGLALGVQFPIRRMFGVKAEAAGYNNVSGADIRQLSVGLTLEF
ncbi:MAG TPA: outer membrane beta-barrel protein [Nitrospira sp.]|nr:outer membrane beta-barrel protein [Nitrospira sp.]